LVKSVESNRHAHWMQNPGRSDLRVVHGESLLISMTLLNRF